LELGYLLLGLLVCVIVWVCEDERDRLGREVSAADQPFVSLKGGVVSSDEPVPGSSLLPEVVGSGC
jgi:hypothetical protein